jgi:tRNA nucleotidyltransferase (CCA-adding enzyme)
VHQLSCRCGFGGGGKTGCAPIVAQELHAIYPSANFVEHDKFQTAELIWQGFTLDLTTARREVYPHAGANPIVRAASLHEDLERRDFTINALAVELKEDWSGGTVIDLFGGIEDLERKLIRSIREGSFAEDPRRMFRAVRFACRLDFQLSRETEAEVRLVCASGLHDRIGGSRLRLELVYILREKKFRKIGQICHFLQDLGAWRCVDPNWLIQANLTEQLRRLWRWCKWFEVGVDYILLGMEVLLWNADTAAWKKLEVFPSQLKRREGAYSLITDLQRWSGDVKVSEVYDRLQMEDVATLVLVGALTANVFVWRYLTVWRRIQPMLTGRELMDLGYPKGKSLGRLLQGIRTATLDGLICTKSEAISFAEYYWKEVLNYAETG